MSARRAVSAAVAAGLLFATVGCGGGDDGTADTTAATFAPVDPAALSALGAPYAMDIEPGVVPGVAEPDLTISDGSSITYRFPEGTYIDAVQAWYRQNMAPGDDYMGLTWLRSEDDPQQRWTDHYWCRGYGEVLYVTIGQDLPGSSWVMIGLGPAPEDDCRATPKRTFEPYARRRP